MKGDIFKEGDYVEIISCPREDWLTLYKLNNAEGKIMKLCREQHIRLNKGEAFPVGDNSTKVNYRAENLRILSPYEKFVYQLTGIAVRVPQEI